MTDNRDLAILLRHLEDLLLPLIKGEQVTDAHRVMARGLWERVLLVQDDLRPLSMKMGDGGLKVKGFGAV